MVEEAVQPRPRPSAAMLTPRGTSAALGKGTPDDEILQTLRDNGAPAPAPPRSQPVPPVVKTPPPAVKPLVAQPSAQIKAKQSASQSWILWVGLLGAVIAGGLGAILILKHSPQAQTPAASAGVTSAPGPAASAPSSPTATTAEKLPATVPDASAPTEAPQAAAAVPEPVKKTVPKVAEKVKEAPPPVRPAGRERAQQPAPERARTMVSARPAEASDTSAVASVGAMVVWANVDDARITIDDQSSPDWTTPHEFSDLPVGPHRVQVTKPGYDDVSGRVVIQAGRTVAFNARLTASGGEINIITNPPGLGVSIDGGPFSPSPVQVSLGAGTHTYRVQLPNSRVYEGTFEMRTGAIITRRVDFSAGEWLNPTQ